MILRPIATVLFALGCARSDVADFWRPGGRYELKLVLGDRPSLTPEQERFFSPKVDSATLSLSVDSVVGAKAYGKVVANARHFPVAFLAVGGDHFSATRSREHWTITINPDVTDTGLALEGELSHGGLAGNWAARDSSRANGRFHLAPTT